MIDPKLAALFDAAIAASASDLHFVPGEMPRIRALGDLSVLPDVPRVSPGVLQDWFLPHLPDAVRSAWQAGAMPFVETIIPHGVFHFVALLHHSNGDVAATVRILLAEVPTLAQVGGELRDFFVALAGEPHGLILITGPHGSGKQTTAFALVQEINARQSRRIYLVEDTPSHRWVSETGLISPLIIGQDMPDYDEALRFLMRGADPDVVYLADLPTASVAQAALTLARTGHLVIANAAAPSALAALATLSNGLTEAYQAVLQEQLLAVTNQRLLRKADGSGRVPAYEVVRGTQGLGGTLNEQHYVTTFPGDVAQEEMLPQRIARFVRTEAVTDSEGAAVLTDYFTP